MYLSGIRDLPLREQNQIISDIHLDYSFQEQTAFFSEYSVNPFHPGEQLDSAVVFYYLPIKIKMTGDQVVQNMEMVEEKDEETEYDAHRFSGSPEI